MRISLRSRTFKTVKSPTDILSRSDHPSVGILDGGYDEAKLVTLAVSMLGRDPYDPKPLMLNRQGGYRVITRITGKLVRLGEADARIDVGSFEYEVFVPEFVRRQLQASLNESVSLKTIEYIEGNPQQGRLTPRLVGFLSEAELEFFELVCSVDGMGVKKTLRSMVRPVREVAEAIEEQNVKELCLLPGIGPAMAERIVAKLRRRMAKFALMIAKAFPEAQVAEKGVLGEALEALISLGFNSVEAREKVDAVVSGKTKFKTVEDVILAIYQQEKA